MMNCNSSPTSNDRTSSPAGFALIMVISILGFLVVIVLSLASMLRVSTTISDYEYQQAEIRESAWSAAIQGLSKLQDLMGNDQSYSAKSEAFYSEANAGGSRAAGLRTNTAVNSSLIDYRFYINGAWRNGRKVTDSRGTNWDWLYLDPSENGGASGEWKENIVPGIDIELYRGDPADELGGSTKGKGDILFTYWIEDEGVKASYMAFKDDYSGNPDGRARLATSQNIDAIFPYNRALWTWNPPPNSTISDWLSNGGNIDNAEINKRLSLSESSQGYFLDETFYKDGTKIALSGRPYDPETSISQGQTPRIVASSAGYEANYRSFITYDLTDDLGAKEAEVRLFNSVGMNHIGLLVNASSGGLKDDMFTLGPQEVRDWLDLASEASWTASGSNPSTGRLVYAAQRGIYPVITDFRMHFEIEKNGAGDFELGNCVMVQIWNPYTSAIEFDHDIDLYVSKFPLEVDFVDTSPSGTTTTLDFWNNSHMSSVFSTQFETSEFRYVVPLNGLTLLPGRVYTFELDLSKDPKALTLMQPKKATLTEQPFDLSPVVPSIIGGYTINYRSNDSARDVEVRLDYGDATSKITFTPGTISDSAGEDLELGYRVILTDPGFASSNAATNADRGNWLNLGDDIRKLEHAAVPYPTSSGNPDGTYYFEPAPVSPLNQDDTIGVGGITERTLFSSATNDYSVATDFSLYELPRMDDNTASPQQMITSIANLQHAPLRNIPYLVGNPVNKQRNSITAGDSQNDWFDKYYFDNSRYNPRLRTISALVKPGDALEPAIIGAFNVNSLSVEAWEAVLRRGMIEGWGYVQPDADGVPGNNMEFAELHNPFFRFPLSAHETFFIDNKIEVNSAPREYFRRGVREFTNAQIRELAEQIVVGVREFQARGANKRPFNSLKEFIDEGIIETAIANAGLNKLSAISRMWNWAVDGTELSGLYRNNRDLNFLTTHNMTKEERDSPDGNSFFDLQYESGTNVDEIWRYAPYYLTQADVLSSIDPFLTVRSDTFKIRGYAEKRLQKVGATTLEKERLASAMVELLVQRTYEPISGNNRKFKIIGVRWIDN